MAFSPKNALSQNIKALQTALKLKNENRIPTSEEIGILNLFIGWGGIKALLYPIDKEWSLFDNISKYDLSMEKDIKEFYNFLLENFPQNSNIIWNDIKNATLTSFFTPEDLVDQIINKFHEKNLNINSFLDPSAGMGIYVDKILKYFPDINAITAVEKDYLTALILQEKYKGIDIVSVINLPFEKVDFKNTFDFIASNIPFGDVKVAYPRYDAAITNQIHNFFAYHASKLLNEGGQLSIISSAGLMNSRSNFEFRKMLANELSFDHIITLPNNLFTNNGTEVTSHLISAVKNSVQSEQEVSYNETFIGTYTDENDITLNEFVVMNPNISFLGKEKNIDTNQYGNPEYNYQLEREEMLQLLDEKLHFKPLQIKYNHNIDTDILEKIVFETIADIDLHKSNSKIDLLQLLRVKVSEEEKAAFYPLAVIKAMYRGYEIPVATILRSLASNKALYAIDSYIKNESLFKPIQAFTLPKDFRQNLEQFSESLEVFSKEHSLEVFVESTNNEDGNNFKNYFFQRFNQPELATLYRIDLDFYFHKEPEIGMLLLDESENVQKIINIENIGGDNLYTLENASFEKKEGKEITVSALKIYRDYNSLTFFERKLKAYRSAHKIEDEKVHTSIERVFSNLIKNLNISYDFFASKFGFITDHKTYLKSISPSIVPVLLALELENEEQGNLFSKGYKKASIFNQGYEREIEGIFQNLSVEDGLVKSINTKGKVDIGFIASVCGIELGQVKEDLQDLIIYNPIIKDFELKDVFLAGNIYQKLDRITALDLDVEIKEKVVNELLNVLPEKIPYHKINKQFGSRWIPSAILNEFCNSYFESTFSILFSQGTDTFSVKALKEGTKYSSYKCINNRYIRPEDIISNAFYDIYPVVTYSQEFDGKKIIHTDHDATHFYKREITNIKNAYSNYLNFIKEEQQQELEKIYNTTFNAIVVPKPNGFLLDFSDLNLSSLNISEVYEHQKDAVWHALMNQGGIIDHEVGFGKTLTMCCLANKMKRLNVIKKPIIIGLKANVKDLALAYKSLYPDARVLFPSSKDYQPENREIFLNKIKNNDWDVIIMSHSQFVRIPQDERVFLEIYEQEISDIEENLYFAHQQDFSKAQLSGLEKRKKSLEAKRESLFFQLEKRNDRNVMSFADLGIDHIIIDESHEFKNLEFQTRHARVAGLGQTTGGQETMNILTAIRTIQKNTPSGDFGATFFSGTPISNSLTELYLLQKYLTPNALKEKGILNFDAWAANFAVKSIEFEANVVNNIVPKERFRYFINIPELALMYNQMAHVMNARINPGAIDRPDKIETLTMSELTPLQKRFNRKLAHFLMTANPENLNLDKPINLDEKNTALSILAMNLAFKASIDMRLINSSYPDDPKSKINTMVEKLLYFYRKYDNQKGTQIVFSDLGTSKKKLSFQELEDNYKNNQFTSVYDDIKYKLMKSGIPEGEIAFVQNWSEKKEILNEKMNSGEIRILIGGTKNAGTGVNVQERLINIEHLTIPWKPSEFEQRDGRGQRKGNWIAKVHNGNKVNIGIMGTKMTLDNYKIDLNKNKAKFIDQIRLSSNIGRIADEGEMDENTGMGLAELQAQLMGDNTLLEKTKIDRKLKELEQEKLFVINEVADSKRNISRNNDRITELDKILVFCKEDVQCYKDNVQYDKNGTRVNLPKYKDLSSDAEKAEIYNYFLKLRNKVKDLTQGEKVTIGEMYGFELKAENTFWDGVVFKINRIGNDNIFYTYNDGKINFDNENSPKNFFINCFNSVEKRLSDNLRLKQHLEGENIRLAVKSTLKFDKEQEILDLNKKSQELEIKLTNSEALKAVEYPIEEVSIDGEKFNIKVLDSFKLLEEALLSDQLGGIGKNNAAKFSYENFDILKGVSGENKNILVINSEINNDRVLASYIIKNYDLLYVDVCNFMKVRSNNKEKGFDFNEEVSEYKVKRKL